MQSAAKCCNCLVELFLGNLDGAPNLELRKQLLTQCIYISHEGRGYAMVLAIGDSLSTASISKGWVALQIGGMM
ncbi:MAG TPA: hypothetical protein V6C90_23190 [Coleofasciculaceae cyanobacterium]